MSKILVFYGVMFIKWEEGMKIRDWVMNGNMIQILFCL